MANPGEDLMLQKSVAEVESPREVGSTAPSHGQLNLQMHHWLKPGTEVILLFDRYMARTTIVWLEEPSSDARIEGCVRLLGVSARTDTDCTEK